MRILKPAIIAVFILAALGVGFALAALKVGPKDDTLPPTIISSEEPPVVSSEEPPIDISTEPPVADVVYDSPEERAKEMMSCPGTISPDDMEYFQNYADFDGYKTWLYDKCGVESKLCEAVAYEPSIPYDTIVQGPLTTEQEALLDQMAEQVLGQ